MEPLRAAARALLRTHGPMSLPALASRLVKDGHDLAEDLAVLDDHLFPFEEAEWTPHELADGRLVDVGHLLDGLVLTTLLTDEHVADGGPTFSPDLDPLLHVLVGDGLPLADGGTLSVHLADDDGWHLSGPAGWMPGAPGQMLVVRLEQGRLHLDAIDPDDIPADPDLVDRLADTHDRVRVHVAGVEIGDLVIELRARHPRALTAPRWPLGDLLADAGLAVYGDWVVEPEDLDEQGAPLGLLADDLDPSMPLEALALHLVDDHGMTEDQADDFLILKVLTAGVRLSPPHDLDDRERQFVELSRILAGDDPDDPVLDEEAMDLDRGLPRLEQIFADDDIAQAIPSDLLANDVTAAGPFAVLSRRIAQGSRNRYARSNAWWLYAQALELLDADGLETERAVREALEASRDHVAAAVDLAWHLDDRGKAGPALGLLVEHGLGESEWAETLRGWAAPGPASAGRNDPCPCGSGRKHKVCCARHNGWPLVERIDWVFDKLSRFRDRTANAAMLDAIVERAGRRPDSERLDDMAVVGMFLFEGEMIAAFCDLRGPLLPADELELLRTWAEALASAYEVVEVDPGAGMQLLDLTTGERHEVVERTASRQLQPGEVLLTWLVPYPDGTTRIALGGVQVPVQNRPSLLALLDQDPTAEELADWYAGLFAPPRLHNTDGDPLTMCETVVAVPDAQTAHTALAAAGAAAAEVTGRPGAVLQTEGDAFHLLDTSAGGTVIGVIRPDGTHLRLETNSVARIEALQDLVLDRVAGAEIVDDTRTPIEDVLGDRAGDDGASEGLDPFEALDDLDPDERAAMVQALDDWMTEAEDRWCDEAIPALGGATPRQAADDPTRRADLEALLDEFPRVDPTPGQARGMDPDRLRALLGLSD